MAEKSHPLRPPGLLTGVFWAVQALTPQEVETKEKRSPALFASGSRKVEQSLKNLGRHREGQREGVELLKDLHGFLNPPPAFLRSHPPPPF